MATDLSRPTSGSTLSVLAGPERGVLPAAHRLHDRADRVRARQVRPRARRLVTVPRPRIADLVPGHGDHAMYGVGVIEVVAGLVVAWKPPFGGLLVAAWLAGIIPDLLTLGDYYDVALRDFGLLVGALALSALAAGSGLGRSRVTSAAPARLLVTHPRPGVDPQAAQRAAADLLVALGMDLEGPSGRRHAATDGARPAGDGRPPASST